MRQDISDRFIKFAARIIKPGKKNNKTFEGRHVYGQLFRSGSSSGANYEESHSAQSTKDFIHKREVSLKELRESLFWLKLITEANLVATNDDDLIYLLKENDELIKIVAKSVSTTKSKLT